MNMLVILILISNLLQVNFADKSGGVTVNLKTDGLPDPYQIDLSTIKANDSFYQSRNLKILGGYEAPPNFFPYKAALYITLNNGAYSFCGGSVISQHYILTAAHCVMEIYSILIVLGATDLGRNEGSQLRMYAKRYVYHAQYKSTTLVNDIAVLYLHVPINYNDAIKPIRLPSFEDVKYSFENVDATVIGWGKTTDYGSSVTKLRYLTTRVIPNSSCKIYFGSVVPSNICTGGFDNTGSCHGDSGSPLIYDGKQVGIVSFGSKICSAGLPSVYTRVTSYLNWIAVNTDVLIDPLKKSSFQNKKAKKILKGRNRSKVFNINKPHDEATTKKLENILSL